MNKVTTNEPNYTVLLSSLEPGAMAHWQGNVVMKVKRGNHETCPLAVVLQTGVLLYADVKCVPVNGSVTID